MAATRDTRIYLAEWLASDVDEEDLRTIANSSAGIGRLRNWVGEHVPWWANLRDHGANIVGALLRAALVERSRTPHAHMIRSCWRRGQGLGRGFDVMEQWNAAAEAHQPRQLKVRLPPCQ